MTSIPLRKDSENQSKKQSHPSELSENCRMGDAHWSETPEREKWLLELVDDQNAVPGAPPRSKIGREKREQRCHGKSDVEE